MVNKLSVHRCRIIENKRAVKVVSVDAVDKVILSTLLTTFSSEIKELDRWVLFPDHSIIKKLERLIEYVRKTYYLESDIVLYRGFNASGNQEKLGIKTKGFFKKVLEHGPGYRGQFKATIPLSFTSDLDIAKDFGNNIVRVSGLSIKDVLPITDEINYALNIARGFDVSKKNGKSVRIYSSP